MINVEINSDGFASGESWDRIVYDPNIVDTYTIKTMYPLKYHDQEKYRVQYAFRDFQILSNRIDLSESDTVIIPNDFLKANNHVFCIFTITLIDSEIDVMTSTFELVMTLQSSCYLNPDANKFVVVPTYDFLSRFSSDYLADGKVVKVAYDKFNNQLPTYYTWNALKKDWEYESSLNRISNIVDSIDDLTKLAAVPGDLVFVKDTEELYCLTDLPASNPDNWIRVFSPLRFEEITDLPLGGLITLTTPDSHDYAITARDFEKHIGNWAGIDGIPSGEDINSDNYIVITDSDGTQSVITIENFVASIGNWKPILKENEDED